MTKKYKAGVIGAGNIGFMYSLDRLRNWASSHLQAYKEHPDFEPVAICDINRIKLKEAKSYLPFLNVYTSWKEMLKNETIDVLSVCVSPRLNLEVCESALLKNIRAVILEKPLAQDVQMGRRIIKALKARKVVVAVNYFRRWQKTFWKVKELLDTGRIGEVLKANGYYPSGILTGGSHMIDILHYLLSDFTSVQTLSKTNARAGDSLYSVFCKIGDIEVYLCGFDKKNFNIFDIEIWGKKGKIIISEFGERIVLQQTGSSKRFTQQKELLFTKEMFVDEYNSYFSNLLNNITAVMWDKKKRVLCTAQDALKTTAVIRAIEDSFKYGKEISLTRR